MIIGVSQTIQFKRRNSRLGELLYVRIFISAFELMDICIIMIIVRFWLNFCVFWEISRNRLAGDEPPPSDSSILSWFWGSGKELPGGTLSAIRRRVGFLSVSGFWMKGLAVVIQPPGDASDKSRF